MYSFPAVSHLGAHQNIDHPVIETAERNISTAIGFWMTSLCLHLVLGSDQTLVDVVQLEMNRNLNSGQKPNILDGRKPKLLCNNN